ncbi:MAG TPA: hypothetical protein VNZ49_03545 [Bacteroidia bacterium]|jgi:hypothetical protein|nr:hypothetical protein [Bacteroidia bacterium]
MGFKHKVFDACLALLEEKINSLKKILSELEEGSQNDSKSSAGDKHETSRAMMQLEQEKISKQLKDLLEQKSQLKKSGSLVKTNNGFLFLSIPMGKVVVDETGIMAISPQSPLGLKLFGLKAGDKTEINGTFYLIESVE